MTGIPFNQGSAPMPNGCICDPFDYAALGHMLNCPCYDQADETVPGIIPVPVILHCPKCLMQHIDVATGEWANPPHKSHLCLSCGCIWRPCDAHTMGVASVETRGEADTWP